jgi:hypothetical protein
VRPQGSVLLGAPPKEAQDSGSRPAAPSLASATATTARVVDDHCETG